MSGVPRDNVGRHRRQRAILSLLPLSFLYLSSCAASPSDRSIAPPPEYMAINYAAMSSRLGYVTSLGYFTEAEVDDPRWERSRRKRAGLKYCQSPARIERRDVRWVPAGDGSAQKCAVLVYTLRCFKPRDMIDDVDPPFADGLERDRHFMLTGPAGEPSGPGCGSKIRAPARPAP
ncbi:MAG: hypothetical protein ABW164_05065 [Sphingobium sp.]